MSKNELKNKLDEICTLYDETEWIEFKVNNSNPQEIGEYISALSNSACLLNQPKGYLVFGIEDKTLRIVGTNVEPSKMKKGSELLEPWLAQLLNPRIDFVIYETQYNDSRIVIFEIDATYNQPVHFRGEAYIRVGTYKKKLKDYPEKERKIWHKTDIKIFEKNFAIKGLNENDVLNLIDYQKYYELINQTVPLNETAILDKLIQEKIAEKERSKYSITNLGAILFAKDLSNFDSLSRKAVRVIIYSGKNRLKTIKEQDGIKGYAVGFEGLVDYINDQLPTNEVIEKAFRKQVKMYPELAIRELVANALIHQDFSIRGTGPMVEIFEDRVEISNPGKPLIDTLRFIDHNPISRNEHLASLMRRMNMCEERGSGIDKVVFQCEVYQLPAPSFDAYEEYFKATLYAHKSLGQMDNKDKTRSCYLHCCLKYVQNEMMTNESLRGRFGIEKKNSATASRIIAETIEAKLIKDYDTLNKSKKYAKYIPFWA